MKGVFYFVIFLMITVHCTFGQVEDRANVRIVIEGPKSVRQGQAARYALVVKNIGTDIAKNVVVRVKIPYGMGYNTSGKVFHWNFGNLAEKEEKVVYYVLDTPKLGRFENRAFLYVDGEKIDQAKIQTRVIQPALKAEINGPRLTIYGRLLTYWITIKGEVSVQNLEIVCPLPPQLEYIRSSQCGVYRRDHIKKKSSVIWKIDKIKLNSTMRIKLITRAKLSGRTRVLVKLRYKDPEFIEMQTMKFSCPLQIKGFPPLYINLYETKDPCEVGKQTTYIVECINEGPCTILAMKNSIPRQMEYIGANGPTPHKHKYGVVYFEPIPILQARKKVVYTITCKAVAPGFARNKVIVTYKQSWIPIIEKEEITRIDKP